MQPYIFPYIGYFQLIQAVDTFTFYDDVNYIKGGWVNRNRILLNGKDSFLTIPCIKASPNKKINEILFDNNRPEYKKLVKTLSLAYKKAPYYHQAFPLIENILNTPTNQLSVLAAESIKQIANYLNIKATFLTSSLDFPETKGMDKTDRLIALCKRTNAHHYINPIGGIDLYEKDYFKSENIELSFIKPKPIYYRQFNNEFVPWLSIIDVLMFNSVEEIKELLDQYILE